MNQSRRFVTLVYKNIFSILKTPSNSNAWRSEFKTTRLILMHLSSVLYHAYLFKYYTVLNYILKYMIMTQEESIDIAFFKWVTLN